MAADFSEEDFKCFFGAWNFTHHRDFPKNKDKDIEELKKISVRLFFCTNLTEKYFAKSETFIYLWSEKNNPKWEKLH